MKNWRQILTFLGLAGGLWAQVPSANAPLVLTSTGGGGGGAVTSVNSQTGAVVLGASDVGAAPVQVVENANFTAAVNGYYVAVSTLTVTDPTPSEGAFFQVLVRAGTATIGGTAYTTAGTLVARIYHSGAWGNYVLSAAGVVETIATFTVDGQGAVITTGTISGTKRIPFACTLTGWSITATAATGTNTIKIWEKASATTIPTISNVINTSGVSLTTGTAVNSSTISDFTATTYAAGDMMRCAITAVDGTATDLTVTLYGIRL